MARLIASCAPLWDLMECAVVGSAALWGVCRCGECAAVGRECAAVGSVPLWGVRRCGIS